MHRDTNTEPINKSCRDKEVNYTHKSLNIYKSIRIPPALIWQTIFLVLYSYSAAYRSSCLLFQGYLCLHTVSTRADIDIFRIFFWCKWSVLGMKWRHFFDVWCHCHGSSQHMCDIITQFTTHKCLLKMSEFSDVLHQLRRTERLDGWRWHGAKKKSWSRKFSKTNSQKL